MTFKSSALSAFSKIFSPFKVHWNNRYELLQQSKNWIDVEIESAKNSFLTCMSKTQLYLQAELPKALATIEDRLKQIEVIDKCWWRLHVIFPQIYYQKINYSDFFTPERIKSSNENTKLPQDESAQILIFWITEAYGPNEISSLYAGLEALNWNSARFDREGFGCINWIKRQRELGISGSQNIGVITRPGENRLNVSHDYNADLPSEVSHLIFKIEQICPSLTCINIGFVFKDSTVKAYEDELSLDRDLCVLPIKDKIGSLRFEEPFHIKQNAIESRRRHFRKLTTDWISGHFPGIFCSGSSSPPTAELITTRNTPLFDPPNLSKVNQWARIITQPSLSSTWQSDKNEFLQIGIHDSAFSTTDHQHLVVTFPTNSITDEDLKIFGNRGTNAYALLADTYVNALLIRFAMVALINTFRSDLMRTRDLLKAASPDHKGALKALYRIQRFFSFSVQVPSIAREIAEMTNNRHAYKWECRGFSEVKHPINIARRNRDELLATDNDASATGKLDELLAESTNIRSTRLIQDDIATRDSFRQLSEVLLARANVKTQRTSIWLSFCAILLAGMSVWLAIPEQNRQQLLVDAHLAKEEKKPKLDCVTISRWTRNLSVCMVENEKAQVENPPTAPSQKKPPWSESHPAKKQ